MAAIPSSPININGHMWIDVTNTTHGGISYPLEDVIACGGRVPDFVSCRSDDYEPKRNKLKRIEKFKKNKGKGKKQRDWE